MGVFGANFGNNFAITTEEPPSGPFESKVVCSGESVALLVQPGKSVGKTTETGDSVSLSKIDGVSVSK